LSVLLAKKKRRRKIAKEFRKTTKTRGKRTAKKTQRRGETEETGRKTTT
jgi:hypothetical protein